MQTRPLGLVTILRVVVEPMRRLMAAHFKLSSMAWETEQRAKYLAFSQGAEGATPREFRVTIAAEHKLENEFFGDLRKLFFEVEKWEGLPMSFNSVRTRALAFRLLSSLGCAIQELLVLPHSRYPLKLFLMLADPSIAEVVSSADECELDSFTEAFVERFAPVGLASPDSFASLRTLALILRADIADVESRLAAIRRWLMSLPQARRLAFELLSSMWAGQRFAKRQSRHGGPGMEAPPEKPKRPRRSQKAKNKAQKVQGRTALLRPRAVLGPKSRL